MEDWWWEGEGRMKELGNALILNGEDEGKRNEW